MSIKLYFSEYQLFNGVHFEDRVFIRDDTKLLINKSCKDEQLAVRYIQYCFKKLVEFEMNKIYEDNKNTYTLHDFYINEYRNKDISIQMLNHIKSFVFILKKINPIYKKVYNINAILQSFEGLEIEQDFNPFDKMNKNTVVSIINLKNEVRKWRKNATFTNATKRQLQKLDNIVIFINYNIEL